jgi:hypothetical protein
MPILACKGVRYFSQGDETAFFDWIGRISCVTRFEGARDTLSLHVRGTRIADRDLRELLALFYRYRVPMKQLAQFENPRNRTSFARPGMYCFARVGRRRCRQETSETAAPEAGRGQAARRGEYEFRPIRSNKRDITSRVLKRAFFAPPTAFAILRVWRRRIGGC